MERYQAIALLRPGAQWVMHGTTITWLDKVQTQPTEEEITNFIASYVPPPTMDQQIATLQAQVKSLMAIKGANNVQ